jgi:hypothetical protein
LFGPEMRLSEAWLAELSRRHRNIVQLTPPTPLLAESAEEALDRVFDEMVIDPARLRFRFKRKHIALGSVRAAYRRVGISRDTHLQERVTLQASNYSEPFDFAVTNRRVVQLVQTWSFQIPDQAQLAEEVKAFGWTVERLRDGGGVVATRAGLRFDVDRQVDIEATYIPPDENQVAAAFAEAIDVFRSCNVRQVPYLEADVIGRRARDLLGAVTPQPA